jgi:hypothetical protein
MYNQFMLPKSVKAVLWSYNVDKINPKLQEKLIVAQVLNYGTKEATDWLFNHYGKDEVRRIASLIPKGQWDKKSLALWSIVLGIDPKSKKTRVLSES